MNFEEFKNYAEARGCTEVVLSCSPCVLTDSVPIVELSNISYEEASYLSLAERKIIREIIDDNLETTKKTKLPFY